MNTAATLEEEAPAGPPAPGQLVRARGRSWVVAEVDRSDLDRPQHLVTLTSVEDDAYDETVQLRWEVEPGTRLMERATLPTPHPERFDDPDRLAAFLDAVRWGAVTVRSPPPIRRLCSRPSGRDRDRGLPGRPGGPHAPGESADRRRRRTREDD